MLDKTDVLTVSQLTSRIKKELETNFGDIWVEGEVSNYYRHSSKHIYFDLKDEESKIKVVMFYQNNIKLDFKIENGLNLLVNGNISVYKKRGEYQVIALDAKPVGKGSLIQAYEQLKKELESKGYFDQSIKKILPGLPTRIGLATSVGGAVLRDIVSVLERRSESFHLIVRNINVQGPSSEAEVCSAISDLEDYGVDVIIIARGGGSLEDLWAFNTEGVAKRVFDCTVPVISAVGHETDFTICDFVSDKRAATPSVAAEIVIMDKSQAIDKIRSLGQKMQRSLRHKGYSYKKELSFLLDRKIFKKPQTLLINRRQNYDFALDSLYSNMDSLLKDKKHVLKLLLKDLDSNSPVGILEKGYCLAFTEGRKDNIRSIGQVDVHDIIEILLRDGEMSAKIMDIKRTEGRS